MVCLDARQAALNMKINKTDDNDAEGLAHLVRSGWYREVRVKSREAMLTRSLLGARTQLLGIVTELSNQILLKTLVVPKGAGKIFEANVRRLLEGEPAVAAIILPLLESWRAVRVRAAELDRQLLAAAREVSPADDRPRRRRRRRGVLRGRHRDAGSLQEITRRRRLDRLDATALPVGRG